MATIDDICRYYQQQGSIRGAAQLAGISEQKTRKLLITAGAIQPEKSREALLYLSRGLEKNEAAKKLGISVKALESYLPYSRMPYNQPTRSPNAEKLARWRATGSTLPNTGNED
jgi:DNA-directed RNA polymerase specialized sigma24 family protein